LPAFELGDDWGKTGSKEAFLGSRDRPLIVTKFYIHPGVASGLGDFTAWVWVVCAAMSARQLAEPPEEEGLTVIEREFEGARFRRSQEKKLADIGAKNVSYITKYS
jgi:hypothetical protein